MNTFPRPKLFALLISVTALAASPARQAYAQSGGEHSGGGGHRELQFKNIGYELVEKLGRIKNSPKIFKSIDYRVLKKVVDTTEVSGTDRILRPTPNGKPEPALIKDMLNRPGRKRIEFNVDAWDAFPSGSSRAALVLHEYLGIMKHRGLTHLDDSNFAISRLVTEHYIVSFIFDVSETCQPQKPIPFDFPIYCTYSYRNRPPVRMHPIGSFMTSMNSKSIPTRSLMSTQAVAPEEIKNPKLMISMIDESDMSTVMMGLTSTRHPTQTIRITVGWSKTGSFPEEKDLIQSQSLAITPNFEFETTFTQLRLKLSCKRGPRSKGWDPVQ